MCHSDESRPSAPPVHGEVASRTDLRMTVADGNVLLAHAARAGTPSGTGIVVLPDVRGPHASYRELAARFAEAGLDAVAIDYFGRTSDTDERSDAFDYLPHVRQATSGGVAVYDGAPHSFFDRSFPEHREACTDACRRMLEFVA